MTLYSNIRAIKNSVIKFERCVLRPISFNPSMIQSHTGIVQSNPKPKPLSGVMLREPKKFVRVKPKKVRATVTRKLMSQIQRGGGAVPAPRSLPGLWFPSVRWRHLIRDLLWWSYQSTYFGTLNPKSSALSPELSSQKSPQRLQPDRIHTSSP